MIAETPPPLRIRAATTGRRVLLGVLAVILLALAIGVAWGWGWLSLQSGSSPNLMMVLTPLLMLWLAWVIGRGAIRDTGVDVRPEGIGLIDGGRGAFLPWQQIRCVWVEVDAAREVLRVVPADRSMIEPRSVVYPVVNRHGYGFDLVIVRPDQRDELFAALQAYAGDALGMPISAVAGGPAAADPRLQRRVIGPRSEFSGYPRVQRTGVVVLSLIGALAIVQGLFMLTDMADLDGVFYGVTLAMSIVVVLIGLVTFYYAVLTASVPALRIAPDGVTTHASGRTTHVPWAQIREVIPPTLRHISVRPVDRKTFPRGRRPFGVPRPRRGSMLLSAGALQVGRQEVIDAFAVAAYAAGRPDAVAKVLAVR